MKFEIIISDNFFSQQFKAEAEAESEQEAIQEIKEYYAQELDTDPDSIEIISIQKIN